MRKVPFVVLTLLCLLSSICFSQIKEAELLPEGVLFPRYPDNAKPGSPQEGLCFYNTDLHRIECYDGQNWVSMSGSEASRFYLKAIDLCGMLDETGISIADVILNTCTSLNFTCGSISDVVLYEVKLGTQPMLSDIDLFVSSGDGTIITNYPGDGTLFWITVNLLDANNDIIGQTICSYTAQFSNSSGPGSYADIASNAPDWACVLTANEYLAEYLRQNPDVSYWDQDHPGQLITPLNDPVITGTIVNISPTGSDDTQLIEDAISQAGQDGAVDGGGSTFLIDNLIVNQSNFTLRNISLKPSVNSAYKCITAASPDVTFFQVTVDLENKPYQYGIDANANADRFALVESTITNLYNNSGGSGAMLRLSHGTDDVYIVNNEFIHGIGESPPDDNSLLRGIVVNSTTRDDPKSGIIASNLFEDLQAEGRGDDADAMFFGNFASRQYQIGFRMTVMANVGINAGKRLIKAQGGGVDAHSNVNHWKDYLGELGVRTTRCHYDNHGVSNTRWTNNLGISDHSNPNSEAFFMQIGTHLWSDNYFAENIVFNCNKNIQNENTEDGVLSYGFVITDYSDGANATPWPANSEIKNNVLEGPGTFKWIWWFRYGNDPLGTQFDYSGNQISVNYEDLHRQ